MEYKIKVKFDDIHSTLDKLEDIGFSFRSREYRERCILCSIPVRVQGYIWLYMETSTKDLLWDIEDCLAHLTDLDTFVNMIKSTTYEVKVKSDKIDEFLDNLELLGYSFMFRDTVVRDMHKYMNSKGREHIWICVKPNTSLTWGSHRVWGGTKVKLRDVLGLLKTHKKEGSNGI